MRQHRQQKLGTIELIHTLIKPLLNIPAKNPVVSTLQSLYTGLIESWFMALQRPKGRLISE